MNDQKTMQLQGMLSRAQIIIGQQAMQISGMNDYIVKLENDLQTLKAGGVQQTNESGTVVPGGVPAAESGNIKDISNRKR